MHRRFRLAILAAALLLPPALLSCQSKFPGQSIRIGSYNLENLFDNSDDPYTFDEQTSPKSYVDLLALAATIDRMDVDVLAVQEVENRGVLERLNRFLKRPFAFVELLEGNDPRGIDCGILSRFPLRRSMSHRYQVLDSGMRFSRDLAVFQIEPSKGKRLLIAPAHLKSKRSGKGDPQSNKRRASEARGLLSVLSDLRQSGFDDPLILLGDFNDFRKSESLRPLFAKLKDATELAPRDRRYSYIYGGKKQQIDFILGDGNLKFLSADFIHDENSASDHHPPIATLQWPGKLLRKSARKSKRPEPPYRTQIRATDESALKAKLLEEVILITKIVSMRETRSGGHMQLFAEGAGKKGPVFFVPRDARRRLGDLTRFRGKRVRVEGPLFRYRGKYEIKITRKAQIHSDS